MTTEVSKSITVNRPPAEVYRFWRGLENLPRFMVHLESVRELEGGRSHWVARAPLGARVEWDAVIVEERDNEVLAWRSLEGAAIRNSGEVRFVPVAGDRGTEVRVSLRYDPPAGALGVAIATVFGEEPAQQVEGDMRRFKQIMEAGEIATTEGQPSGRARDKGSSDQPEDGKTTQAGESVGEARDHDGTHWNGVDEASDESFPASDPPAWN